MVSGVWGELPDVFCHMLEVKMCLVLRARNNNVSYAVCRKECDVWLYVPEGIRCLVQVVCYLMARAGQSHKHTISSGMCRKISYTMLLYPAKV